jgi:hypothetical protein
MKTYSVLNEAPRHEDVWRSGSIAPSVHKFGTRRTWVVSFTPWQLYRQGNNPGIHWIGGWVGPRAGLDAMEKGKNPCPCRESNPSRPVRSLVTVLTRNLKAATIAVFQILAFTQLVIICLFHPTLCNFCSRNSVVKQPVSYQMTIVSVLLPLSLLREA